MAREWSRRSIEELVRGYMRRHTPPSSGGGSGYIKLRAEIPTLYDASGQEIVLPLYELEILMRELDATAPDEMMGVKFSDVPPIYFKNTLIGRHYWVIGLFAGYKTLFGFDSMAMDLYDEAGGLVATVYIAESSGLLNPFSALQIPDKVAITKSNKGYWGAFPGAFFGTEALCYGVIFAEARNATNPLPDGWTERVKFYKFRSQYE